MLGADCTNVVPEGLAPRRNGTASTAPVSSARSRSSARNWSPQLAVGMCSVVRGGDQSELPVGVSGRIGSRTANNAPVAQRLRLCCALVVRVPNAESARLSSRAAVVSGLRRCTAEDTWCTSVRASGSPTASNSQTRIRRDKNSHIGTVFHRTEPDYPLMDDRMEALRPRVPSGGADPKHRIPDPMLARSSVGRDQRLLPSISWPISICASATPAGSRSRLAAVTSIVVLERGSQERAGNG